MGLIRIVPVVMAGYLLGQAYNENIDRVYDATHDQYGFWKMPLTQNIQVVGPPTYRYEGSGPRFVVPPERPGF